MNRTPAETEKLLRKLGAKEAKRKRKVEEAGIEYEFPEGVREKVAALSRSPAKQRLLYVSQKDIKGLKCFRGERLMAIRAPHGTTLEVPDPSSNGQRRYRIILKSNNLGPIEVYAIDTQGGGKAAAGGGGGGAAAAGCADPGGMGVARESTAARAAPVHL